MKYITDDGKTFATVEEAANHEAELAKVEKEKKQKEIEKENLSKKIEEAFTAYEKLLDEYLEKYGEYSVDRAYKNGITLMDMINRIF